MEKHWSVSVNIGANNILNIGENYLSGWDDVMDYADTVQCCAEHLLSFIGREAETTTELRAEVLRLTALCDGYRGEVGRLKVENGRLREELGEEEHDISLTDKLAMSESVAEQWMNRAESAESALTRARAEGMEEAAKIADVFVLGEDAGGNDALAFDVAAAIRSAAKGGQ